MKSRKKLLIHKRKKFRTIFLQRWLVVLIILALFYAVGLSSFVNYKKNEIKTNYYFTHGRQIQFFGSLAQEHEGQQFINRAQMRLAMLPETNKFFSLVCDKENGEVLAGCEERMFFVRNTREDEDNRILVCELENVQGWQEYRQKLEREIRSYTYLYEFLDVTDIYTDGDFFIPKELQIDVTQVNLLKATFLEDFTEKDVFREMIKGTKEVPEGYIEENTSEYSLGNPIVLGYSTNNPYLLRDRSSDNAYKLLYDYYEDRKENPKSSSWEEKQTFFTIKLMSDTEVELGNGQKASVLSVAYLNVWENYGGWLFGIAIAVLLVGTLAALLLAKLSYTRIKAAYNLEDYRKTLTNTMAHDLKSPLMSISGYAENLRDNLNTEKQPYYSQAILNNVQYMNSIIESVLYLSKMEEGKLSLKKESIHAKELLEKLVAERAERLQERELKVEMTGDAQLKADAILLEQLLCNLLDNAVKYASKNTTICVMMKDKEISIQNACEEDLSSVEDALCQPFVVGDASRSNQKGSGLGLAIARNICDLHGFGFELICEEKSFEAKIKG